MHIEPMDDAIYQGTANDGSKIIFKAIENLIRKYPEHYHWSYKRFKASPETDNIYHLKLDEAVALAQSIREKAQEQSTAEFTPPTEIIDSSAS